LYKGPRRLQKEYAMVHGRGEPSAETEKGRKSVLVRGCKVILGALSREDFRRDTVTLAYNPQQESRLTLGRNRHTILAFLTVYNLRG